MVLTSPLYNTRGVRSQSTSAHGVLSKTDTNIAVRPVDSVMGLGTHGHIFCLDLLFFQWSRSLRAVKKKVENVKDDLKRAKEKLSKVCGVEDQALLYVKRPEVYSCDRRQRDLFKALVSEFKYIPGEKRRLGTRCCRWLTTTPLESLHVSTLGGQV